jgi:predicted nuclease of predicted toxin-antitoxin system
VKFLVDNQLPAALALYLRGKGLDCSHVVDAGLAEASDVELSRLATADRRIIITKDEDFFYLATRPRATFQLIWVRLGNSRTAALIEAFEKVWPTLEASLRAGERIVEIR